MLFYVEESSCFLLCRKQIVVRKVNHKSIASEVAWDGPFQYLYRRRARAHKRLC